ncbi:MAG: acyl--CoA ligase [Pseudonocardiales bacterium]|nr:acyl--CoA ligase [Pseudonocardiales bacterium]
MIQEAAQRDPTVPIVLDKPLGINPRLGKSLLVGDLAEIVETFAGQLYRAGVRPGDRVAVYKTNNADIMAIACALSRVRAVPVLLSPLLPADAAARLISRAGPRYVLTDSKKIEAGELDSELIEESGASVLLTSGSYGDLTTVTDLESAPIPEFGPIDPTAPCVITHTSGTTREPKLVEQNTQGLGTHITLQLRIANALRVRERWALCVSFVHIRTYSALGVGLSRRMPFAFLVDHDVDTVRDVFTRFRPGLVETHPNTFIRWESLADDPARPLSSARYYINTFDAIHPRTVRVLLAASDHRFPLYFQAYGQTESGPVTVRIYTRRGAERANGRCVGYPIPGLTGVRLRNGRKGLSPIEIRSRGRAITYLGEENLFASQVDGVWWDMGDVGYRGRWGCVHLLDRAIDHIEGLNSVLEIEDKLMSRLPELREIILVPKGDHTIQPIICTKTDSPLDSAVWQQAVQDLPPMAEPVQCTWEDLPQTATSKVKRVELQKIVQQDALPTLGMRPPAN